MSTLEVLAQKENQFIKVMVYGPSGAGKTVFGSSFPGKVQFADFDGKVSSAARYWAHKDPAKLKEVEFTNYQPSAMNHGVKVFHKFQKDLDQWAVMGAKNELPFKTFVLDSLTTFAEGLLAHIMDENPGVKRVNSLTPAMQDYLMLSTHFKPIIYKILSLPCNVVVIGHISHDKDETTGEISIRPALPGKLPELLPILFEEVYRAFTEVKDGKVVHFAQTRPAGKYVARTQIPAMPNVIPLSYAAIKVKMDEKIKEAT